MSGLTRDLSVCLTAGAITPTAFTLSCKHGHVCLVNWQIALIYLLVHWLAMMCESWSSTASAAIIGPPDMPCRRLCSPGAMPQRSLLRLHPCYDRIAGYYQCYGHLSGIGSSSADPAQGRSAAGMPASEPVMQGNLGPQASSNHIMLLPAIFEGALLSKTWFPHVAMAG